MQGRADAASGRSSAKYRPTNFSAPSGSSTNRLHSASALQNGHSSAGRMMNGHFATRSLNEDGSWKNLMAQKNSSADISPTSGQMPRLLGLAYASKIFRNVPVLQKGFEEF